MKLRLTKKWYETRAKVEEDCMDITAAASIAGKAKVKAKASQKKLVARPSVQSKTKQRAK
jgi:hypothetical protein